jgi:hypothetical protein
LRVHCEQEKHEPENREYLDGDQLADKEGLVVQFLYHIRVVSLGRIPRIGVISGRL